MKCKNDVIVSNPSMVTLPTSHSLTLTLHGRISSAAVHLMCNVPYAAAVKCAFSA